MWKGVKNGCRGFASSLVWILALVPASIDLQGRVEASVREQGKKAEVAEEYKLRDEALKGKQLSKL